MRQIYGKIPCYIDFLKGVNGADYPTARALMCSVIGNEASRFYNLFSDSRRLNEIDRKQYAQLVNVDTGSAGGFQMSDAVLMGSLKTLSMLLEKCYGEKVIILIDEYDVPLSKAYERNYYDKMVLLIRNMLRKLLKQMTACIFQC